MLAAVAVIASVLYLIWIYQPILTLVAVAIIAIAAVVILVSVRRGRTE